MGKQRAHHEQIVDGTAKILDEAKENKGMNNERNQEPENKAPETAAEEKKNPIAQTWNKIPKKAKTIGGIVLGTVAVIGLGFLGFKVFGNNSDDSGDFDQDPIGLPFDEPDDTVSFDDFSVEEKPESETENVEE